MKIKKSYTTEEILSAGKLGLEFEFYSNIDGHVETARSLSKFLGKRVVVPMAVSNIKKPTPLYHSPVNPSDTIFKLEPDYSGGKKMCELVTGPMKYSEARNVIIKVLEWITNNGYTNERCSIHANVSIDGNALPTIFRIPNLNLLKFILSFDEEKIYDVFPARRDSVYSRSIKEVRPNKASLFISKDCNVYSQQMFRVPDEKYYGVNFLKAEKGYLEYRYMGGDGYEKKTKKILGLIEYFITHLHSILNFQSYNDSEIRQLKKMIDAQNKAAEGFIKYENFKKTFPDIKVSYDMNDNDVVLEGVWTNLREKLYEIIMTGGMKKGEFNYDSEVGRFQLKNTKLKNCKLADMEFVGCEVEGVIERSAFYNCKLKNSRFTFCDFAKGNTIDFSKVTESPLHVENVLNDCFIENKTNIINCEVNRGVIRNGEIGKLAKISKETMIVEQKEPTESSGSFKNAKTGAKEEDKEKKKDKEDETR
jgi:hypothetical protein